MTLRLVAAGLAHVGAIGALQQSCFDDPWSERSIAEVLVSPGAFGFVALQGTDGRADRAAGYAIARIAGDEAELLSLAVAAAQRRRGIARRLIDEVLRVVSRRGVGRLYLEVAEDNATAQSLYVSYGFVQVGRRDGYYRRASGATAALTMCRAL